MNWTSGKKPRLRKRGEKILHSKYVVILVILLTITDCALVIAELILDLYSVKKTLSTTEGQTFRFIHTIRRRYPDEVTKADSIPAIYDRLAKATILWNTSHDVDDILERHPDTGRIDSSHSPDSDSSFLSTSASSSSSTSMPHSPSSKWPDRDLAGEQYSKTVLVDTPESTSRSSRSIQGSFNNENNRIFVGDGKEPPLRDQFNNLLEQYLHRYRRSIKNSTKENPSYNVVGDDENHFENLYNDSDFISNELQQLSRYITMQVNSTGNGYITDPLLPPHSAPSTSFSSLSSPSFFSSPSNTIINNNDDDDGNGDNDENGKDFITKESRNVVYSVDRSSGHAYSRLMGHAQKEEVEQEFWENDLRKALHKSKEMEIAHKLHYASLCVVSVLLIEVSMKIVCAGSHFLKRKIEVFDAVIIVLSVVVDLIFIKGLSDFAVDDTLFVLAFLLPWRVIRVVNSLVMAVIDHEHVKLRLLYSRKKKLDRTVDNLRNEMDELKGMLQEVRQFCIKEGIEATKLDSLLGKFAPRRRKDSKFYTLVKLVMSSASINNNNDNVSISSSSIENDLREYACRDSVINESTSNENTMTSLKQYLSVPFFSRDTQSISDYESSVGDGAPPSPCIFVTSPGSDDEEKSVEADAEDDDEDGHDDVFTFDDLEEGNDDVIMTHDGNRRHICATTLHWDNEDVATLPVSSGNCTVHSQEQDVCETSFTTLAETSRDVQSHELPGEGGAERGAEFTPLLNPELKQHLHTDGSNQNSLMDSNKCFLSVPEIENAPHPAGNFYLFGPHDGHISSNLGNNNYGNNNNNNNNTLTDAEFSSNSNNLQSLPPNAEFEMRRSASDMVGHSLLGNEKSTPEPTVGDPCVVSSSPPPRPTSPPVNINVYRYPYGSPVPLRKLSGSSPKRKFPSRRSSTENEGTCLLNRSTSGRARHHSGEPDPRHQRRSQSQRARSYSPSPMNLLAVPGGRKTHARRHDITSYGSRSMQDVSDMGGGNANNVGPDGKILRSSCLSLNGGSRKRRGKSPHRVSFKVS